MKIPSLKGLLDWKTLAVEFFDNWEIQIRDAGETPIYWFGDLMIRHGDKESGVVGGSKLSQWGKYICGHWHSAKAFRRALQLGCGCMLGPKYVGGRITSWQNQIAYLTKANGVTGAIAKTILHDKKKPVSRMAYRNKVYEIEHYYVKIPADAVVFNKA
jgi:hypothetical protein